MRKIYLLLLISLLFTFQIFSQNPETELVEITNTVSTKNGTCTFYSGLNKNNRNCIVAQNKNADYQLIYESPFENVNCVSNICVYDEILYFSIHDGTSKVNGKQIFLDHGVYTLAPDNTGRYCKTNLKRYAQIENWLMKNVCKAYLADTSNYDSNGFLNYIKGFADAGSDPVFVIQKNNNIYCDEEAVNFLLKDDNLRNFYSDSRKHLFPFEKYLYKKDSVEQVIKNGKTLSLMDSAFTCNESEYFFNNTGFLSSENQMISVENEGVFLASNVGSEKENGWSHDYSVIYKIEGEGKSFKLYQPKILQNIHSSIYKSNNDENPLYINNSTLCINDIDGNTKWIYSHNTLCEFTENNLTLTNEEKSLNAEKIKIRNITFALLLVFVLLIFALTYFLVKKAMYSAQKNQTQFIYSIQEKERAKISSDIHDSVVQDIRAIRLQAEMIETKDTQSSIEKKKRLVEDITNCIIKMRNICYGLTPAELQLNGGNGNSKIELISIIDTLCSQFTKKTNIPCTLSIDEQFKYPSFKKEISENIIRIIQEAFVNIEKHSFATEVKLFIRDEIDSNGQNYMTLFIIDDGKGCNLDEVMSHKNRKSHFGLANIQERCRLIGASVNFYSNPDDGMKIMLKIETGNN